MRVGVYPGSFHPPTIAHLAIADAARLACRLDRLDLVISHDALGKPSHALSSVSTRIEALRDLTETRPWLRVATTTERLVVDIAAGYDVVVLGADKWAQVVDVAWYDSPEARDAALALLPHVAVAPRPPHAVPRDATVLRLPPWLAEVSASAVRAGRVEWAATTQDRH